MALVKVYNDNIYPYKENFKGENIHIPAKGFIEMEYDEAILFKGMMSPMVFDGDGNDLPQGYKMIRVEEPGQAARDAVKLRNATEIKCFACNYEAKNQIDYLEHAKTHADNMVVDPELDQKLSKGH